MDATLEEFVTECHRLLKSDPGPKGRERVVGLLQDLLHDSDFIAKHLGPNAGTRDLLYEDRELGFCVFAHAYEGAAESRPHDHGPSWAIYGQASGESEMTDWELVEPASEEKAGKVRPLRSYPLKPGTAHLYNEGDLHSPKREGAIKLIRIEGRNMDNVKRFRFEAVEQPAAR
jgi:hypothetical protein